MGLFVSLYLILLAFFIVLNAISNQSRARTEAVIDSLVDTFERPFQAAAKSLRLTDKPRATPPPRDYRSQANTLMASIASFDDGGPSLGGNVLKLSVPDHALFFNGQARLSRQADVLLRRMAVLVQDADARERREVTIVFGRGSGTEDITLSRRRADAIARMLVAQGMPPGHLAVGLRPGPADSVGFEFSSRPTVGSRVHLGPAAEEIDQ